MSKRRLFLLSLLLLAACIGGAVVYPVLQGRREVARRLHEASDILVASKLYAVDHAGCLPMTFGDLSTLARSSDGHRYYELPDGSHPFLDRAARELEIVAPGALDISPPQTIFLRERIADRRGRRVIGYVDASAVLVQSP